MALFKILSLTAFVVVVRAGPPAIESYGHYAASPLAYASPQVHYAPQVHHAPLHYAAPVAKAVHHAPLHYAAPVIQKVATPVVAKHVVAEEYDPHPQYSYAYSIQDALTGDSKAHEEVRDGGVVKGSYSLVEPDGSIRTVTYTADSINGFNAVVDRTPPVHVKAVAPVVKTVAAPVAYAKAVHHAPIAYASPVAKAVAAPIHGYGGYAGYASPISHGYASQGYHGLGHY